MKQVEPRVNSSQVPYHARINSENFQWVAGLVYKYGKAFICQSLIWLKETGGVKALLIRFPDAIVSISNRINPATLSGRVINKVADVLTPLHALGGCASPLLGFADVGFKFQAMFDPFKTRVQYTVRGPNDKTYQAQFSLKPREQAIDKALSVVDWTSSFIGTGCPGYILNRMGIEKFPLALITTCSSICMSINGLYSEYRFFNKTWGVDKHKGYDESQKKEAPVQCWDETKKEFVVVENATVAWEELVGSALKISLSVVCLSLDLFKEMAAKENPFPWLDTAIFCAGLAPTFIAPVAMRYWPKIKTEPLYAAASA